MDNFRKLDSRNNTQLLDPVGGSTVFGGEVEDNRPTGSRAQHIKEVKDQGGGSRAKKKQIEGKRELDLKREKRAQA